MAELIDELLPASFLQRCIGAFLDMLADNAAEVKMVSACKACVWCKMSLVSHSVHISKNRGD